jgi:hypothetical protein
VTAWPPAGALMRYGARIIRVVGEARGQRTLIGCVKGGRRESRAQRGEVGESGGNRGVAFLKTARAASLAASVGLPRAPLS